MKTRPDFDLAAQIRVRRKVLGWSQNELAKRLHTSQKSVVRLENPETVRCCSVRRLDKIAKVLGLNFHAFMRSTE